GGRREGGRALRHDQPRSRHGRLRRRHDEGRRPPERQRPRRLRGGRADGYGDAWSRGLPRRLAQKREPAREAAVSLLVADRESDGFAPRFELALSLYP